MTVILMAQEHIPACEKEPRGSCSSSCPQPSFCSAWRASGFASSVFKIWQAR